MQLNIYTISHPIIELLTNSIINTKNNKYKYKYKYKYKSDYKYKYSGFLLMYEILRKYIKIQKIYIKHIYSIKNLYFINSSTKHIILTDLSNTYNMITEIKSLIPDIEIIHTEYKNQNNYQLDRIIKERINYNKSKYNNINIFILDIVISDDKITRLIKLLENQTELSLNNINIACIACYENILSHLGKISPKLKVYTTKILYN
uniref:Uracil phosphoribosyltransferase n=1 Tax=Dasyclonium flaccidum TaxID=2007274 RepID=A0A1Z1MKZ4_9FLOR|nr:uracil phosphoribosyltransferase [Dasyclonium flaccidum]ARW66728.1 uracil phosphoribosyltransferase [Dasyclonium flaccidum]